MHRSHSSMVAILFMLLTTSSVRSEVYVFGDSLSDTGNFNLISGGALPPTPPYAEGRFSNGHVWAEYLTDYIRAPRPTPSLLGGTNFSFNGARAAGISPFGTPDLQLQVELFITDHQQLVSEDDVFLIWVGANDIFFGSAAGETEFVVDALTAIANAVSRLEEVGGRNFVILNVPKLGQTPYFNSEPEIAEQLDAATDYFNTGLNGLLEDLKQSNQQAFFIAVDIAGVFEFAQNHPRIFRLENTNDASTIFDAGGTGLGFAVAPDADPTRYLFWDGIHPTTRGHEIAARTTLVAILSSLARKLSDRGN